MSKMYPHTDQIKGILSNYADFVHSDGLNYLIPNWQRFADQYADSEDLIHEWLNDLDTRKIIDEILDVLPDDEKEKISIVLASIDKKIIDKTFEINECIWGHKVESENNYNRNKNWYYYRINQKVFDSELGQYTRRL